MTGNRRAVVFLGALDEQPEAVVLPDLPLPMLDRTELAMQATVCSLWLQDSSALEVCCPVSPCSWSREWEYEAMTVGTLAEAVQQHLNEAHPTP